MTDAEKIVKIIDELEETAQDDMTNAELNILKIATGYRPNNTSHPSQKTIRGS